jgi:hypothetical protein
MNAHEEIIRALREHRMDLEREKRARAIKAAFEKVRELPVDAPPPPQKTIQAELLVTETVVEAPMPSHQLASLAQPLLQQIQTDKAISTHGHRRRYDGGVWTIDDVFQGRIDDLYAAAEASLGRKSDDRKR